MNEILIQKAPQSCKREECTQVRVDKEVFERIKEISTETGYSTVHLTNFLLREALKIAKITD